MLHWEPGSLSSVGQNWKDLEAAAAMALFSLPYFISVRCF